MSEITETIPAGRRRWSVSWPQYTPVDVTPPELRPSELARDVPDWAEAAATPDAVTNWAERQADALVPFELDGRGWPLHPAGRTGRTGRNLGCWGENQAADPIVIAGAGPDRQILLITRDDIRQEAIPGGMVDSGETAPAALVRELREETGVDLSAHQPVILGRDLVDDWRQSDHAWVASTSALYVLPATVTATAADDALDATWYPAASMAALETAIAAAGRTLYAAHRPLIARALTRLAPEQVDSIAVLLDRGLNDSAVLIQGHVAHRTITKLLNGDTEAVVMAEDYEGSIPVLISPRLYRASGHLLTPKGRVTVRGVLTESAHGEPIIEATELSATRD